MEIRVDRGRCVASGLCMMNLPNVFDQSDEDGKVLLRLSVPEAALIGAVRAAVERCPGGAITMSESTEA